MILTTLILIAVIVACSFGFYISILNETSPLDMFFNSKDLDNLSKALVEPALLYVTDNSKIAKVEDTKLLDQTKRLHYDGVQDCVLFKKIYGDFNFSGTSCLGFGTCVSVCPQNTISIKNDIAIIGDLCNGCGICIPVCPQGVLSLISRKKT